MSFTNASRKQTKAFYFSRAELSIILSAYATRVSNCDWRDYALDHIANCAIFSIFRHTHEQPLFTIEKHRQKGKDNGVLLITHYQRLLDYIVPDFVHVLADGQIIQSGDKNLALELEAKGYTWLT